MFAERPAPPLAASRTEDRRHLAAGLGVSVLLHGAALVSVLWFWQPKIPVMESTVTVSLMDVAPAQKPAAASQSAPIQSPREPVASAVVADEPVKPPPKPARKPKQKNRPDVAAEAPAETNRDPPVQAQSQEQAIAADASDGRAVTAQTASIGNANNEANAASATVAGVSNPAPVYPYPARERGEQGRVVLLVVVSASGQAAGVTVAQSSGFRLLDDAAVKAVKRWRFQPARRAGATVPGQVEVPIVFRLTDRTKASPRD